LPHEKVGLVTKRLKTSVVVTQQPAQCKDTQHAHRTGFQHPNEQAKEEAAKDDCEEYHGARLSFHSPFRLRPSGALGHHFLVIQPLPSVVRLLNHTVGISGSLHQVRDFLCLFTRKFSLNHVYPFNFLES
jgi:hypothetical protein